MWDPSTYLAFADARGRPFVELLARVGARSPRRVVDLGCGPGNLTATLRERWPRADVVGIDSSTEMVAAARERGLAAELGDVTEWSPPPETDVVVCNAVLQWVPEHRRLLRRWLDQLGPGAWLAFQVPGNFDAPSHRLIRELAAEPAWAPALADVPLRGPDTVGDPREYAELAQAAGWVPDAWETTYQQRLTGDDPVLDWVRGTALRPMAAALGPRFARFTAELAPRLRAAYPPGPDGTTLFPFRRIFVVAHRAGNAPEAVDSPPNDRPVS